MGQLCKMTVAAFDEPSISSVADELLSAGAVMPAQVDHVPGGMINCAFCRLVVIQALAVATAQSSCVVYVLPETVHPLAGKPATLKVLLTIGAVRPPCSA